MMTVGGGIFALRRPRPCSRAYAGMQMRHAAKASRLPMTECHYAQVFNPLNAWLKTIYPQGEGRPYRKRLGASLWPPIDLGT